MVTLYEHDLVLAEEEAEKSKRKREKKHKKHKKSKKSKKHKRRSRVSKLVGGQIGFNAKSFVLIKI